MRIVLTQSPDSLQTLEQNLQAQGYYVERCPLIRTQALQNSAVQQAAAALLAQPWILFTSPAGVRAWHELGLALCGIESQLGAVGEKTARVLRAYGAKVALVAEPANAEGFAAQFIAQVSPADIAEGAVGLPRGDRALLTLQERLEQAGFATLPVVLYETLEQPWPDSLTADNVDVVLLASPSAAQALPEAIGNAAKLISLGPSTGAAIGARGWRFTQAQRPDAEAIAQAIAQAVSTLP